MYSFKQITKSEARNMSFLNPVHTETQNSAFFSNKNNKQPSSKLNSPTYRNVSTKDLFDSKNFDSFIFNSVRTPTENFTMSKANSPKTPIHLSQTNFFTSSIIKYQNPTMDAKKKDNVPSNIKQSAIKQSKIVKEKTQQLRFSDKSKISLRDTDSSKKSLVLNVPHPIEGQSSRISKKQLMNNKIEQILIEQKVKKQQILMKKASLDLKQLNFKANNTLNLKNNQQNLVKITNPKENCNLNKLSRSDFIPIRLMGKGKFGDVHMVKHKTIGFIAALKTIKKKQIIQQKLVGQLIRELKIHSFLNHPNIVDFYGSFEDKQNIYILLQLGSEGQLYTKLKLKEKYSQQAAAFIIKSLLSAVRYMHSKKLLHRDIKPENIVITHGIVKLCDFGWAIYRGNDLRKTFCGTPLYVSPEILTGQSYDQKTDLWAIGILAYELVIGNTPFQINQQQEMKKIVTDQIRFPKDINLSEECKDFIFKMLKKNPKQRLTCEQLLKHPFMQRYNQFQTCQELCNK